MLRNLTVALTMGCMLFVGACSDDDGAKDDGGITLMDGSSTTDTGNTPTPDTGAAADLDCMGIITCVSSCADLTCLNACIARGEDQAAKDTFNALNNCFETAGTTTCATQCTTPTAPECASCLQGECGDELTACQGGGGPVEAGFGDFCNASTTPCTGTGMQCLPFEQNGDGFCSKACDNPLGQCAGAPTGTFAGCMIPDGAGGYFCGFLCTISGTDFPCPSTLVCSTEDDPPASGQFACVPPPAQ